jgi:hypothetical protein
MTRKSTKKPASKTTKTRASSSIKTKRKAPARPKKVRLESKARIRRRLFKLWHDKVMLLNGNVCAVSGIVNGAINIKDKASILDAHHIECKEVNPSLRFDALNGIALSKSSHKFGRNSFHKAPLWAAEWLRTHRPLQYDYILAHRDDKIDLEDREVLYSIEAKLKHPPTEAEKAIVAMQTNS